MNWLPNDLSTEGTSSLGGPVIRNLKTRSLEMPFPAIMSFSLTSKKEKPWKLCHISEFDFYAPLLTKANRGT